MLTGIYTITNLVNNKLYVGLTTNFKERFYDHLNSLRRNCHANLHLQSSWNKYGEDNFCFEILEECETEFLYSKENYWCNMLNVHDNKYGYNIAFTNPYGNPRLQKETIVKISAAKIKLFKERGYFQTEESCKKRAETRRNNGNPWHSDNTKKLISESRKNIKMKPVTKETCLKISKANKGKPKPPGFIDKLSEIKKKPIQLIKENNDILEFDSIKSCAEYLCTTYPNCTRKSIETAMGRVLNGKKDSYKNQKFKYI